MTTVLRSNTTTPAAGYAAVAGGAAKSRAASPSCIIRVLGAFAFEFPQSFPEEDNPWRRAHARRLLQIVGSAPRMSESRAKVLAALWPDFDEQRARNRLHHTVHWIRKGLEHVPQACRPQIVVSGDRVQIQLAPGTVIDAQAFVDAIQQDADEDMARLAALEHALGWYRGEFAPDWQGVEEAETRRAWLAGLHQRALDEAVQLAIDLGRTDNALHLAQRRAQLPGAEIEAHRVFAGLLSAHGRADAALAHCRDVRVTLQEEDPAALPQLDEVIRDIQQSVNRQQAAQGGERIAAAPAASERPRLPARRGVLGYQRLLDTGLECLADPYATLLTLVGPPGSGKTAIACELAHRTQDDCHDGAAWVDCTRVGSLPQFLLALAQALDDEGGAEPNEASIGRALHAREMLVVLDGLEVGRLVAPLIERWMQACREVRWIVTAWSPLQLRGEKQLVVDATALLATPDEDEPLPAVQLLARACPHRDALHDRRVRGALAAIARAVDGLPMLLEAAGEELNHVWPNELMARIDRDPLALLRPSSTHERAGDRARERLQAWLKQAPRQARQLLAMGSRCRSWLTREDLATLLRDEPALDAEAVVDFCVRQQFMLRRVRVVHQDAWSEFRVPSHVGAVLALNNESVPTETALARIAHWLSNPPRVGQGGRTAVCGLAWFEDRIEDMDELINEWQLHGRAAEIARLCVANVGFWRESRHADRVLVWLEGLGEHMDQVPDEAAKPLLVERARLRAMLGRFQGAFRDAGQAVARMGGGDDAALRLEAMKLIDRFGSGSRASDARRAVGLQDQGLEKGESLMQDARGAFGNGELARALQLCGEAIGVFNYFGLTRSLLAANALRGQVAFAMGDTALALQCAANSERAAAAIGDMAEVTSCELLRVAVMLSETQHGQAIERVSALMPRSEALHDPALQLKGMLLLAWAHFDMGAIAVARALCNELLDKVRPTVASVDRMSVELLAALLDVRQVAKSSAVLHASAALDLMARHPAGWDPQGVLASTADLCAHLGRRDLAAAAIARLERFGSRPDHRLRPAIRRHLQAVRALLGGEAGEAGAPERHDAQDLLSRLVDGFAAPTRAARTSLAARGLDLPSGA